MEPNALCRVSPQATTIDKTEKINCGRTVQRSQYFNYLCSDFSNTGNEFYDIFPGFDGNVEVNGEGTGGVIDINDINAISITANSSNNVDGILDDSILFDVSNPRFFDLNGANGDNSTVTNEDSFTASASSTGSSVGDPQAVFDFGTGFSNYLNRFNEVFSFEGAFKLDRAKINEIQDFFEDVADIVIPNNTDFLEAIDDLGDRFVPNGGITAQNIDIILDFETEADTIIVSGFDSDGNQLWIQQFGSSFLDVF